MAKVKQIGGISFSEAAFDKFKTLTYEKQKEQVYNSLSPKDMVMAEKLLKDVPNGDSSAEVKANTGDKSNRPSGGNKKADTEKPATDKP